MAKRRGLILITVLLMMVMISIAPDLIFAQGITDGITWLNNNQKSDGSWGTESTVLLETSMVADTIRVIEGTEIEGYRKAVDWIQGDSGKNTDELARKVKTLYEYGSETDDLLKELSNYQNPDNGFGEQDEYRSVVIPTALVLESFDIAGYNRNGVADEVCRWLQGKQSSDGGWRMVDEDESFVYSTALAVLALIKREEETRGNVEQALVWLQSQQNTDGGFRDDVSTVSNYR